MLLLLFLTDMRSYQCFWRALLKRRLADCSAMKCNLGPHFEIYGTFENLHRMAYQPTLNCVSCACVPVCVCVEPMNSTKLNCESVLGDNEYNYEQYTRSDTIICNLYVHVIWIRLHFILFCGFVSK